jgi:hypothetical protein
MIGFRRRCGSFVARVALFCRRRFGGFALPRDWLSALPNNRLKLPKKALFELFPGVPNDIEGLLEIRCRRRPILYGKLRTRDGGGVLLLNDLAHSAVNPKLS